MPLRYFHHEPAKRMQHVCNSLTRSRIGIEQDKVDRMSLVHCDPDFGVAFETADARAMPCARIHNHDWRLCWIETVVDAFVFVFSYRCQRIVDGPFELTRVHQDLVVEIEQWRFASSFMSNHVVGTLPQRVPEQDGSLPQITSIRECGEQVVRIMRRASIWSVRTCSMVRLRDCLRVIGLHRRCRNDLG